jgi:hypothetical protein
MALLMLSELFLSNLGTLFGNLEATAASLGLGVEAEQARLLALAALDGVASLGALLALWSLVGGPPAAGRLGAWLLVVGLVAYGLYQFAAALLQLAPTWRTPILVVGVVYIMLSGIAWWVGRPLIGASLPPGR